MIGRTGLILLVAGTVASGGVAGAGYAYHEQTRTIVNQVLGFSQTASTTQSVLTVTAPQPQTAGPQLAQAVPPTVSQPEPVPPAAQPVAPAPDVGPTPAPAPVQTGTPAPDARSSPRVADGAPAPAPVTGSSIPTADKVPQSAMPAAPHRRIIRYAPESCN